MRLQRAIQLNSNRFSASGHDVLTRSVSGRVVASSVAVTLLAIGGGAFFGVFPTEAQVCTSSRTNGSERCETHEIAPAVALNLVEFIRSNEAAIVAVSTFLLVLVTGALAVYTYRLWYITREMVGNSEKASGDVLLAMNQQRDVMAGQLAAMQAQASALTAQGNQLDREFASTHRPRLKIREIYFNDPGGDGRDAFPPVIYYTIVNTGGSRCIVVSCKVTHFVVERPAGLPHIPPARYRLNSGDPFSLEIEAFIQREYDLSGNLSMRRNILTNHEGFHQRSIFYLAGVIVYQDGSGVRREMGFCRQYIPQVKRFDFVNDAEYEYAD